MNFDPRFGVVTITSRPPQSVIDEPPVAPGDTKPSDATQPYFPIVEPYSFDDLTAMQVWLARNRAIQAERDRRASRWHDDVPAPAWLRRFQRWLWRALGNKD